MYKAYTYCFLGSIDLRGARGYCLLMLQAREEAPIRTTGQLLAALGLMISKGGSKKALLFQVCSLIKIWRCV